MAPTFAAYLLSALGSWPHQSDPIDLPNRERLSFSTRSQRDVVANASVSREPWNMKDAGELLRKLESELSRVDQRFAIVPENLASDPNEKGLATLRDLSVTWWV